MDRSGDDRCHQARNRVLLRLNIDVEAELSQRVARDGANGCEEDAIELFEISSLGTTLEQSGEVSYR